MVNALNDKILVTMACTDTIFKAPLKNRVPTWE